MRALNLYPRRYFKFRLEPSSPGGYVDLNFGFYFITPRAVDGNVPNSLHGVPAVLTLRGARGVVVSNCSFKNLGMSGFSADGGSQDVTITGAARSFALLLMPAIQF